MLATEVLKEEHRVIEKVLNALDAFTLKLERGEEVNAEVLEKSVDFIRNFADKYHHGKEEDRLFTLMTQQGFPKDSGPIAVMLQEHDLGRSFVKAMDNAIKRYKNGDISSKKDIIENAREYTNLLRQHIYKEDNALYPLADKTL
jgi:hemerythrin-like domain-containing protein